MARRRRRGDGGERASGRAGWSRRQFVGALTLAGGGVLLAACGGTVATPTAPPPVPPTQTVAPVAATATAVPATPTTAPVSPTTRPAPPATPGTPVGTPIGTPGGTPGGGTPVRPGSPSAASPTPVARANPALSRMLALVPQKDPLPGADGIMFADIAAQKRNYGLAEVTTVAARDKLSDAQWLTFQNAILLALADARRGRAYLCVAAGMARDARLRLLAGGSHHQVLHAAAAMDAHRGAL
ncbi:MAG: hypothetical protein U0841_04170 [Chloroflexia bacterium]